MDSSGGTRTTVKDLGSGDKTNGDIPQRKVILIHKGLLDEALALLQKVLFKYLKKYLKLTLLINLLSNPQISS